VVAGGGRLKPTGDHAEINPVNLLAELPVAKVLRYSGASVISVAVGLLVLGINIDVFHLSPTVANVVAIAVCTVPSFELNRRWVWRLHGRSDAGQFIPFCLLSVAGLVLSTLAVRYAGEHSAGLANPWHTGVVDGANLFAYALLWVIRYFILDRVFVDRVAPDHPDQREVPTPRLSPSPAAGSLATGSVATGPSIVTSVDSLAASLAPSPAAVPVDARAETSMAASSADTGSVTVNTAPRSAPGDAAMVP
jgi:putative flippase GtrA